MISNDNLPKFCFNFYCEKCDYGTSKKSSYTDHLDSAKHKKSMISNEILPEICSKFTCQKCSKKYKDNSGLWRHKKKCTNSGEITNELVIKLIKDNKEMKQLIMEQSTTLTNIVHDVINNRVINTNNTNNTNNHNIITNSNNKAFNLNLYLNETCKEAINMSDFVSSIKMNLDDLEHTGRKGYIEGISSIILKNLNKIEQHLRPLHCSDNKREILYIKDNNEWTKECYNKPILTKAIKVIANENIKQIKTWREKNPDCTNADSKKNNLYLKIVSNSMNGLTEEEGNKNINKIISNLAKQTNIDKSLSYNN